MSQWEGEKVFIYVLYKAYAKTDQFKFQLAVSRAQHINVQLKKFNMTPDMILDT